MLVGLLVFGDKSHTDLHNALALTPIIFTLTMFNGASRNDTNFWRLLGYIPNLSYGKNTADRTMTSNKIQDEHNCLSIAFRSLREIHRNVGFIVSVMGREDKVKVWIHFFVGDTEGNNKWLGHYKGKRKETCHPYRDCKCEYDQLSNTNPQCVNTTPEDMQLAKKIELNNERKGQDHFKLISRYDIVNALTDKYMPLSDDCHRPYKMMPPELLHMSDSCLLSYMFELSSIQIGCGKYRDEIDKYHI
jgi:hypothetical protein